MFYKSKKVLTRVVFSSILFVLGLLSIGIGLLLKFVFLKNDLDISNLVLIVLSGLGSFLLFISFLIACLNQRYLQYINNNLLEENKKQWNEQINKDVLDPNSDFVLADEKSDNKHNVEEDEVININIVDDKLNANNNNVVPEIIFNDNSVQENVNANQSNNVVDNKDDAIKQPEVEILKNDNIVVEIQKYEEYVDPSELNKSNEVVTIPRQPEIKIPPRVIPNQSIPRTTIQNDNVSPLANNLQNNIKNENVANNQQGSIPPITIPQSRPLPNNVPNNAPLNRPIPSQHRPIPNVANNGPARPIVGPRPTTPNSNRPIPQRPINIPPKM